MLRRVSVLPICAALLLSVTTVGCTPYWTGAKMQKDIEQLKSEQDELTQSIREKEAELTEIVAAARTDVDELNSVIEDATQLLQRNSADFGAEMEQTRQEMQNLRGQVEELSFKLQKVEQDLKLFKEDVDLRFADGGGAALPDDPDELFTASAEKFQAGEYRVARKGFEKFLTLSAKDRRRDEAIFFIGETFFKENQYVSGIYQYQKILKEFPKSDRLDDSTYRIGESFDKLGKCPEAKVFFETVVKDFKNSKFRDSAQQRLKSLSGKC